MRCLSVLNRVDALRTGEIAPEESSLVREHLELCETCGDSYSEVERFASVARGSSDVSRPSVIDGFDSVRAGGSDLWVAFSGSGLRMIARSGTEDAFRDAYALTFRRSLKRAQLPDELRQQVVDAVEGRKLQEPAVDLKGLPSFEQKVLVACSAIPRGEVRSYSWIARAIGNPGAVRAVGNALNRNPLAPVIPCHRVVPASGGVGNYALGQLKKIELLQREGVDLRLLEELARTRARLFGFDGSYCEPACSRLRAAAPGEVVPLRDQQEASSRGFTPCRRCAPVLMTA